MPETQTVMIRLYQRPNKQTNKQTIKQKHNQTKTNKQNKQTNKYKHKQTNKQTNVQPFPNKNRRGVVFLAVKQVYPLRPNSVSLSPSCD